MSQGPETPLLDRVRTPSDLKGYSDAELSTLADELRAATIAAVSQKGGHLGAGRGVGAVTVPLRAVVDAPRGQLNW